MPLESLVGAAVHVRERQEWVKGGNIVLLIGLEFEDLLANLDLLRVPREQVHFTLLVDTIVTGFPYFALHTRLLKVVTEVLLG